MGKSAGGFYSQSSLSARQKRRKVAASVKSLLSSTNPISDSQSPNLRFSQISEPRSSSDISEIPEEILLPLTSGSSSDSDISPGEGIDLDYWITAISSSISQTVKLNIQLNPVRQTNIQWHQKSESGHSKLESVGVN